MKAKTHTKKHRIWVIFVMKSMARSMLLFGVLEKARTTNNNQDHTTNDEKQSVHID